jgi:hypothetical protein
VLGLAAFSQTPAADARAHPDIAFVRKRISNPTAGGDQVGAIGTVYIAPVAEASDLNEANLALRNGWQFLFWRLKWFAFLRHAKSCSDSAADWQSSPFFASVAVGSSGQL